VNAQAQAQSNKVATKEARSWSSKFSNSNNIETDNIIKKEIALSIPIQTYYMVKYKAKINYFSIHIALNFTS